MSRFPRAVVLGLVVLAMAGACERQVTTPVLPMVDSGNGRIAWAGALPCADCEAIETELVLERNGELRTYSLVETFVVAEGGARFVDAGQWQRDGDLIRMQGDTGSVRAFALGSDGTLQPRDPRGRQLPGRRAEVLLPMTAETLP